MTTTVASTCSSRSCRRTHRPSPSGSWRSSSTTSGRSREIFAKASRPDAAEITSNLRSEGLLDEVVGPLFHRVNGLVDRAEGGDDDDGRVDLLLAKLPEDPQAVALGELEIQQHDVGALSRDFREGVAARRGGDHVELEI